jgi:hypothetical protein
VDGGPADFDPERYLLRAFSCGRLAPWNWRSKSYCPNSGIPESRERQSPVYSGFRPALRKWRRSFAVNAWKIYLGRRLCLRPMGEFHADAGTRDSCVDKSQPSVRRMAFVDVQAAPKCSLPQSVAVQPCAGSHASRPKYPVSRSIARTGSKPT